MHTYIDTYIQTHFLDPSSVQDGMKMKLVTKERKEKKGKENDIGCDYNLVVIESIQLKQNVQHINLQHINVVWGS
jgi:hypothetical protein